MGLNLVIDHSALARMFNQPKHHLGLVRLAIVLQELDLYVSYRKAQCSVVQDTISHCPAGIMTLSIVCTSQESSKHSTNTHYKLTTKTYSYQKSDEEVQTIVRIYKLNV